MSQDLLRDAFSMMSTLRLLLQAMPVFEFTDLPGVLSGCRHGSPEIDQAEHALGTWADPIRTQTIYGPRDTDD